MTKEKTKKNKSGRHPYADRKMLKDKIMIFKAKGDIELLGGMPVVKTLMEEFFDAKVAEKKNIAVT